MGRRLDHADQRPFGQVRRRDRLPGSAAIAREVHQPVVAARPEDTRLVGRFGKGKDGAIGLRAAGVQRNRPARRLEFLRVVAREVRADCLPAIAFVGRLEDVVAGHIERVGIVGRDDDGIGPGKAVFEFGRIVAVVGFGPDGDEPYLSRAMVVALERAAAARRTADRAHIDDVRIVRMDGDVAALAGAGRVTVAPGDGALLGAAGHGDAGVVLLRAVHVIRVAGVDGHVVELGRGLIVDGGPAGAAVERDAGAAVVALDHALRIGRVDPEIVVVAVGSGDLAATSCRRRSTSTSSG